VSGGVGLGMWKMSLRHNAAKEDVLPWIPVPVGHVLFGTSDVPRRNARKMSKGLPPSSPARDSHPVAERFTGSRKQDIHCEKTFRSTSSPHPALVPRGLSFFFKLAPTYVSPKKIGALSSQPLSTFGQPSAGGWARLPNHSLAHHPVPPAGRGVRP
jgi:hypothetical protein